MSEPESELPDLIGPYRVESRLGRGGMGEVYKAWDEQLERPVALKLIRADQSEKTSARRRFRREAQAVARLDHPSIVRIHHIQDWQDHHCIVMEMIEGRTLSEILAEQGAVPFDQAVPILRQIAEGLVAAHAQGIIHRDLKSSNVMLTASGQVKILDFGVAKRLAGTQESVSAPGAVVGTLHTMSPEQALAQQVDVRADLFSLGVLAYELLSDTRPFQGETARETITRVISHRQIPVQELVGSVPTYLSDLIDQLLEKEPARRPQSARQVVDRLTRGTPLPAESGSSPSGSLLPGGLESQIATERMEGPEGKVGHSVNWGDVPTRAPGARAQNVESGSPSTVTGDSRAWPKWAPALIWVAVALVGFGAFSYFYPSPPMTIAVLRAEMREIPSQTWQSSALELLVAAELRAHPGIRSPEDAWLRLMRDEEPLTLNPDLADWVVTVDWQAERRMLGLEAHHLSSRRIERLEVAGGDEDLLTLAQQAARSIEERLGLKALQDARVGAFSNRYPSQSAAFRPYIEGLSAIQSGDFLGAKERLSEALEMEPGHPEVHFLLASALEGLGYGSETIKAAEQALQNAHSLSSAGRLGLEAQSHGLLQDWDSAAGAFGELYRSHPDEWLIGLDQANAVAAAGRSDEAGSLYTELRERVSGAFRGLVNVGQGRAHLEAGRPENARVLAREAVEMAREMGLPLLEAEALYVEASALERLDKLTEALDALGRAQVLFQRAGSSIGATESFLLRPVMLAQDGQLRQAESRLQEYLQFFIEREDRRSEGLVSANLASVQVMLGENSLARERADHAASIFAELGDSLKSAQAMLILGVAEHQDGRLNEAEQTYGRALGIFRDYEDREHIAIVLTNLGELLALAGSLDEAERHFREAVELDRAIANPSGEAYGLERLGESALLRKDLAAARQWLDQAWELGASPESRILSARLEMEESNFGVAEKLAREAEIALLDYGLKDKSALAKIVRTQSLLRRSPARVEEAQELGAQIRLFAIDSDDPRVHFGAGLLAAQLQALSSDDLSKPRQELEALAETAQSQGYWVDALLARLVLAEIEVQHGAGADGMRRLEEIRNEAADRGLALYAERAARWLKF